MLTMSEIERAIAYWEEFEREIDEMPHSDVLEAQREPVKTALTVLRAELDREKNPLTCEGCANLPTKYGSGVYMNAPCRICVRGITTRDYYKSAVEPKGEKA